MFGHVDQGSPPRARGTGRPTSSCRRRRGITPACAGNRPCGWGCRCWSRDHPRVRGEQLVVLVDVDPGSGSPPRARGTDVDSASRLVRVRITPACAGNRGSPTRRRRCGRDHPRVRGEQTVLLARAADVPGSPPRARGTEGSRVSLPNAPGITPACAGNSRRLRRWSRGRRDHPRVRGEQGGAAGDVREGDGSPPRARGTGFLTWGAIDQLGGFHSLCWPRSHPEWWLGVQARW